MSAFDPSVFLDMQVEEANSTQRQPTPAGEYNAMIEKVSTRAWQSSKDSSKSGIALDVVYLIDSPEVQALLGRDKVTVTQGIMLDVTETGGLDMGKGKNVTLGRLRDAVGLNVAGQPFSFRMLEGRPLKVVVSHRPDERPGAEPGTVFDQISGFAKLG